jgi:hypothetical protein
MKGGKMWGLLSFALPLPISLLDPLVKIVCMKTKNDTGKLARLPHGQLVRIEVVHSDGVATVRRVKGERRGQVALCKTALLRRADNSTR